MINSFVSNGHRKEAINHIINDSIAKNGQNPETSPGDLKMLVIQTPVKNHHITSIHYSFPYNKILAIIIIIIIIIL